MLKAGEVLLLNGIGIPQTFNNQLQRGEDFLVLLDSSTNKLNLDYAAITLAFFA